MKKFLLCLPLTFCLLFSPKLNAQNTIVTDSLNTLLLGTLPDTTRVNIYLELGKQYVKDTAQGLLYARQALDLSEKIAFTEGQAKAINLMGLSYFYLSQYPTARNHFLQTLPLYGKVNNYKGLADNLSNAGATFMADNANDSAVFYYKASLLHSEKHHLLESMGRTYANLGTALNKLNEYDSSFVYFRKAFNAYDQSENHILAENCLQHLANTHETVGSIDTAVRIFTEATDYNILHKNYPQAVKNWIQISSVFVRAKNIPKAIEALNQAIAFTKDQELNNVYILYNRLANLYKKEGMYALALENLQKAYDNLDSLNEVSEKKVNILIEIGWIHRDMNNPDIAQDYFERAMKLAEEHQLYERIYQIFGHFQTIFDAKGEYEQLVESAKKALAYGEEHNIDRSKALFMNNMGDAYVKLGNTQLAIETLTASLIYARQTNNTFHIALALTTLAEAYMQKEDYSTALNYARESFALRQLLGGIYDLEYTHRLLSEIYYKIGKFKSAYDHLYTFKSLHDSTYSDENLKKITALEMQFQFDKQNALDEIEQKRKDNILQAELQQQRIVRIFLIIGLSTLTILLIFIFRLLLFKTRLNQQLQIQNEKILLQSNKIEKQNTEISNKNVELEQANQTKDRFFSIIAHDLRSPFNTILGFSEILQEQCSGCIDPGKSKYVHALHKSAVLSFDLLENLLEWANTQRGTITHDPKCLTLEPVIRQSIDLAEQSANQKSISIDYQIDEKINIWVDEKMFRTIVRNLLSNAIKFTQSGGNIKVTATLKNKQTEISVIDNGVGINQENINDLFRLDKKVTTLGTGNEKGTGLGLILCKEFVEKQGGTLWVKSTEGKGSTFSFTVPTCAE